MNTTSHAKTLDRKERARKNSLQWLFTDRANENVVHHISDRRDVGVCTKEETKNEKTTAGTGSHQGNKNDGMLGSLLIEQFLSAVFCPFIPAILQGVDLTTTVDMADEFWMDRRRASNAKTAEKSSEFTYFPL